MFCGVSPLLRSALMPTDMQPTEPKKRATADSRNSRGCAARERLKAVIRLVCYMPVEAFQDAHSIAHPQHAHAAVRKARVQSSCAGS
eukprot:scaffold119330_cov22-Prasinocladus_malaysianus.AAC.1